MLPGFEWPLKSNAQIVLLFQINTSARRANGTEQLGYPNAIGNNALPSQWPCERRYVHLPQPLRINPASFQRFRGF